MPREYDLHWDCHECKEPIGPHEKFVIVEAAYIYHSDHRPPESTGMEPIHVLAPTKEK